MLNLIVDWLFACSLILVPGLLLAGTWRSWSHSDEFTLTGSEKLLRIAILFGAAIVLASLIGLFTVSNQAGPEGWDITAQ